MSQTIYFFIPQKCTNEEIEKVIFRDHSQKNLEGFVGEFSSWSLSNHQYHDTDINLFVNNYCRKLFEIYSKNCPLRQKNVPVFKVTKPWIGENILNLLKFKRYLYQSYKSNFIPQYVYNTFRNKIVGILKKSKQTYIKRKFEISANDSAKTWKNINYFFRKKGVS